MPGMADLLRTTHNAAGIELASGEQGPSIPGVVAILVRGRPAYRIFAVESDFIELGRLELAEGDALDSVISRKHARIGFVSGAWRVEDLASRNGTFVDGEIIHGEVRVRSGSLVRIGRALLLLAGDVRAVQEGVVIRDAMVEGPLLRRALESIALARRIGKITSLLVTGQSGSGKELAARTFHASGPNPSAPLSVINCATIPKELAERLLFGSRRGAFSGAVDAPGYVQSADGGTLFLDEIAELPMDVQSKLLRVLETGEVLRLGANRHEKVNVAICAATWRDLRAEASAGRFRQDLFFRIAQAQVHLPSLRERAEEIPWHIQQVVAECGCDGQIDVDASFVEACALRAWPGNVRELRAEVKRALTTACALGARSLSAEVLSATAGHPMEGPQDGGPLELPDDEFAAALSAERGNVAGAARRLGVHRNRVRRWLERHDVEATRFKPDTKPR